MDRKSQSKSSRKKRSRKNRKNKSSGSPPPESGDSADNREELSGGEDASLAAEVRQVSEVTQLPKVQLGRAVEGCIGASDTIINEEQLKQEHESVISAEQEWTQLESEVRSQEDEREDVQKKTFTKWINSHLSKRNESTVTDLFYDLRDGTKLLLLLEILTDTKHAREKGGMRVHRLSNVRRALDVLASYNVKLVNISADYIVDGSPKITLALVWTIILHWQVQGVLKEVMAGFQQTSLEKTLLAWCRQTTKGYAGVDVRNFSSSWSDGLAFNALLHKHRPELFEWASLANKVPFARLQHAFNLAHEHLGINKLLDPEDVHTQVPDKKSVMMYVMCLFQALPPDRVSLQHLEETSPDSSLTETQGGGEGNNLKTTMRSPSKSSGMERPASLVSTCLAAYLRCLEEVLVWLLGAEERMDAMPEIGDTTLVLKEQFHDLEAVMLELTGRQSGVGEVLKEGSRLVKEGLAQGEEGEEIKQQMRLLNARWEGLRVKAMDRQSKLHVKLMKHQQEELMSLKSWLSSTEERIAAMSPVGSSLMEVKQQLEQHRQLQRDLENEQSTVSSLSNMVVVVDDPASDAAYAQLEDELTALGERWGHVCKWSEQQWATLQALALHWGQLEEGVRQLTLWLDGKEAQLRHIESNPSTNQQHILSQASMLQELQCELEVRHEQLSGLHDQCSVVLSGVPLHSAAHTELPRTLENIQDRWDCLLSIIEAQKTRLAKCGIDISTVVLVGGKRSSTSDSGEVSGDVTTTTAKTAHGSTIITRVITTKSVSSQESLDTGGHSKRPKLEPGTVRVDSPSCGSSVDSPLPMEIVSLHEVEDDQYNSETDKIEAEPRSGSSEPSDVSAVIRCLEKIEEKLQPSSTLNKNDEQREDLQRSVIRELSGLEKSYRRVRGEAGDRSREQQQLVAQWLAVQNMLRRIRSVSVPSTEGQIADRFSLLHSQYSETLDWLQDAAEALKRPGGEEDIRSEIMSLESSVEDGLESLQLLARVAQERLPADTGSSLRSDVAALLHSWLTLDTRLKELQKSLSDSSFRAVDPESVIEEVRTVEVVARDGTSGRKVVEKIETVVQEVLEVHVEGIESLELWLSRVELEISCSPMLDVLPKMVTHVSTLRNYLKRVIAEADRLIEHQRELSGKMTATSLAESPDSKSTTVVTEVTNNMAEVMSTVSGAADKCAAVRLLLERRLAVLTEGIEALEQHKAEVKGLQSWLAEVQVFLKAEEDQVLGRADLETLKAQLLQSNALEDDIATLSTNMLRVEQTCAKLEEGTPPATVTEISDVSAALREEARATAHTLRSEWECIVSKTRQLNDKLIEAVKCKEEEKIQSEWNDWINDAKIPSALGIETSGDLQSAIRGCLELLQELQMKKAFVDDKLTDEERRANVNKQHVELKQSLDERLTLLETALRDYNLFKDLTAAENSWLLELEQKLQLWSRPAVDAEEISAKQDELESFLRERDEGSGRSQLEEVAESLVQRQLMTVAVQNSLHDVRTRRKDLIEKSESVQQSLEKASARAQESEQQYLTLLDRISSLQQLPAIIQTDEHARDIASQIEKEVATDRESMTQLRDQVQVLLSEGNQLAADRLSQQLQLLESKFEEVLRELQAEGLLLETFTQATLSVSSPVQPRAASSVPDKSLHAGETAVEKRASMEVSDRVEELSARLSATGERAKELSLEAAHPAHVSDKLSRCLVVYRELSEVKATIESTLASGRRLVKEKISTQPHTLSSKLDDLKALYNQLGSDVTVRRSDLERGVQQSRKLERDMAAAEKLLAATEKTLAVSADTMDPGQHQQHIQYIKVALEELRVKRPLLTGACESYNYLAGLAADGGFTEIQNALEELGKRWEKCTALLMDAKHAYDAVEEQKEGEMSEYILHLADIKAWLEGTEQKLAQEQNTSDRAALLKVLSEEVVQYQSAVEAIKTASASHILHGTLYGDKLEPELRDISRRWENINAQVKRKLDERQQVLETHEEVGSGTGERTSPLHQESQLSSFSTSDPKSRQGSQSCDVKTIMTSDFIPSTVKTYSTKMETVLNSPRLDSSTDAETGAALKNAETEAALKHNTSAFAKSRLQPLKQPWNVLQSKRQFSVPKFPNKDPTSFDPNSTDHSVEGSPVRPRKRKVIDKDADADNLDDLIASLKRVAEREMKPNVFERIKKKASSRNIPVESFLVEKLSLLNMPKRSELDDDDLESLCSVDTDMAPASETSRDLECTYSDLESVNESVSSRDLLSTTGGVTPLPPEVYLAETSKLYAKLAPESETENYRSEAVIKLTSNDKLSSTPLKNRKLNSAEKVHVKGEYSTKFDLLPVEKLEAMIAELDQVISDTDSNDGDTAEPRVAEGKPGESRTELIPPGKDISHSREQEARSTGDTKQSTELATKKKHENPSSVSLSSVRTSESITTKVKFAKPEFVRSRSVDSSYLCDKSSSNVIFIPSSETFYPPIPENATFVTLHSRPTSEESLASRKCQENFNRNGERNIILFKNSSEKQEKMQKEMLQRSSSETAATEASIVASRESPSSVRSTVVDIVSSACLSSSTSVTTTTKTSTYLSALSDDVLDTSQYLEKVAALVDKIAAVRMKAQVVPVVSQASNNAMALEQEVGALDPEVAAAISFGESLILSPRLEDTDNIKSAIRNSLEDLKATWSQLKAQTQVVKAESELVTKELGGSSERVNDLVSWLNDFNKRLHLLDTDYSLLPTLERELSAKRSAVDELNTTAALLTKYRHQQLLPSLAVVNSRWTEITALLERYRQQGASDPSCRLRSQAGSPSVVPDYVASVNKVRENVSSIARQMTPHKHAYQALNVQQNEIRKLQLRLAETKELVERVEDERSVAIKSATGNAQQTDQVRRITDKLRQEWSQVNRSVNEWHASLAERQATWHSLQSSLTGFTQWLSETEDRLRVSQDEPLTQAKLTQKELEKQVTLKHRVSQKVQELCTEVMEGLPASERGILQQRLDGALQRWRAILHELAARRNRIASEGGGGSQYESISGWLQQAHALLSTPVNVTDESAVAAHTTMVQNHVSELNSKKQLVKTLQDVQPALVSQTQVAELQTELDKLSQALPDYQNALETKLSVIRNLLDGSEELYRWTEKIRLQALAPGNADDLSKATQEPLALVRQMQRELEDKLVTYETLDSTYWVLANDAESKGLPVDSTLKKRMSIIDSRLKVLPDQLSTARDLIARQPDGSDAAHDAALVLQNTIYFEENRSVVDNKGLMTPPSPLLRSTRPPQGSSPSYIMASLDKSILQIRDWLTVVEQMCRQQTVVVGDLDDIRSMTEKQKNVLRELESKKPQLDDLVASADGLKDDAKSKTQQPQQAATTNEAAIYQFPSQARLFDHLRTCFKVAKLREHWDETSSAVLARKTQLDAMLSDSHKLETKRAEVEAWLTRMEHRLERSSMTVGLAPHMLDQQIRDQKGQQAEVQQYKHQMELLNQQTQRLITIYQHDDTRHLRRRGDALNARFNNLQANLAMRGKALHGAMNSTSNFDKALEKFFGWLSEAEASSNSADLDADNTQASTGSLGHRRDHGRHVATVKDLQSEIESHKDVVASLNATGQKLLGTLENQDEALMLHRRLEEMNTRWNTLKPRSIAIRSRLEGNSESWNSLLLSLRELIEWVIRKDTELTAIGPLSGDLPTLAKLESDLVSFRRVLDEKQPVVESNLKSGRQLIASEPPLSDTSDSEAGRDMDGDARRHGEESARELTRAVRREVAKLSEKWAALRERAAAVASNVALAHKKLGVLQKTLEEVEGRLDAAENTVSSWGPVPQDPNLADQHVHNVTKFREGLSDLQRGVDDVNDQAARFSAHNIPLAADNSTRLHRLNSRWKNFEGAVNDRWRQVAGRSREVTPLTAAQLGSSVSSPWERAIATNKVPYYINHAQETTYWDHPEMMSLFDALADLNHIKFSAYRTAAKLRALQKKLALDQANLQLVTDVFDEHGLRGQNDRLIEVSDMVVVLSTLYSRIASDQPEINTNLTTDLCLNWLLNVYDSQRTGQMRVLSFRVGLVCLCKGHLEEKYRYVFRLIADPNRLVDQRKLGLLLHDCVQVPRQLGEVAAFGGSNIEPSVRSCFTKAGKDRDTIEAVHFLSWVQQEPQSLVWLAVLHRVAASEQIQHQVKCNICKTCPIVGLRYRCLKCIGFDMCQQCFFEGRSSKSHKITHPMHEYCSATTAGDEVKDFTKALKNKFKSKRALQKHAKKGYLPVQTVLEGDPLESPSPSPQHGVSSSQDMHNRLEQYASRLAEVELRTNSNSTPDSEDEHGLIAQYCQSLSSGDGAALPVPRSPLQVMAAVDADQKDELEQMIRELEEENQALQAEYEQLRLQQEPSDSPSQSSGGSPLRSEAEMLAEARLLRQHKGRLEARMTILEQHNQQLEAQLHRLRQLLQQNGGSSMNKSGTLQTKSVTASQLATDSPAKVNGHSSQGGASTSSYEGLDQVSEYVRPPPPPMGNVAHVGNLFSRAGDLERAVGNLVATVTLDQERDSLSRHASESRDEPFPVLPQQDHEIEQYDNNPMPAEKDR
ncbi:dystrophin [Hyalella azteca]|uniref:Dystrophin n=1 Tax=Hyalella azteca TaxID=294128 RepID=A0A979FSD3_HYAAZ|nr:dystrophin [Hyalella azteca]